MQYIKSLNSFHPTLYSSSSVVTTRITVVRSMCPSGSSYWQKEHQQVKYNLYTLKRENIKFEINIPATDGGNMYAFHTCMTWGWDKQFAELKCKLTMLSISKNLLNKQKYPSPQSPGRGGGMIQTRKERIGRYIT